jgi:hydrogenase maturation protein HypF
VVTTSRSLLQGRRLLVEGTVQGVGFRPHVWRLAERHSLGGFVRNCDGAVEIVVEGDAVALDRFCRDLVDEAPALARVDRIDAVAVAARGRAGFEIDTSAGADEATTSRMVAPDAALCADCRRELDDPADRRHRYPFVNCTGCGPRFTIIDELPYDRARTSMAEFELCAECAREYADPADRRFHAEPVACPTCGPRLFVTDRVGRPLTGDPVAVAAELLVAGSIIAIKGLGGYQLVCDATDERAVVELRRRKCRPHKPFAVMVADVGRARTIATIDDAEEELLASAAAPIVLVRGRGILPDVIAPGHRRIGLMLPTTPLHHLLLGEVGRPVVMTSGNRGDEPIAVDDGDALRRLAAIADAFVVHDRRIACRYDDSVAIVRQGQPAVLRRARGQAPSPVRLPFDTVPVLAVGAELQTAFCLAEGHAAFVSPHVGDLDTDDALAAYIESLAHHRRLLGIDPVVVAHDLHPDFATTRLAIDSGLPRVGVQHHHAHVAAVMAEHGVRGPVLGVAFDGFGLGSDGTGWGGELLVCDWLDSERVGGLRSVAQPGGDAAVRHPLRMALAHALDAGCLDAALGLVGIDADERSPLLGGARPRDLVAQIEASIVSAPTSSAGRLFDAVAALTGVCREATYEGQPAMWLEQAIDPTAPRSRSRTSWPVVLDRGDERLVIDTRPAVRAMIDDLAAATPAAMIAEQFHLWLATAVVDAVGVIAEERSLPDVCLAGGVFANDLLLDHITPALQARGLRVHAPRAVPPGDGGIALGQVVVAHARWANRNEGGR